MASGRRVGQRPDCHTFLCKFCHFQMAVSQWILAWLTLNLGILWISVCSFWLCESIVANPIIYRLVPRPSRFEIRQWQRKYWRPINIEKISSEESVNSQELARRDTAQKRRITKRSSGKMGNAVRWSNDLILRLIDEYEARPCLWEFARATAGELSSTLLSRTSLAVWPYDW